MNATSRFAGSTVLRRRGFAMGRWAAVATQCAAMIWLGAAMAADPQNSNRLASPAPTIEVVPQQEVAVDSIPAPQSDPNAPAVKPLRDISVNIRLSGEVPANVAAPASAPPETVGGREVQRGYADSMYFWQASNMVHRPLYFEQRYVERYGANFGLMQPIASGVQFAADTALLPAKMLVHPPRECVYSLGYGRPGSSGTRCPRY
ncbi:MAG: hypothetical protein C0483_19110 [Pirellula sp.]|nr:hypothetical protein [Pirellula sp.]